MAAAQVPLQVVGCKVSLNLCNCFGASTSACEGPSIEGSCSLIFQRWGGVGSVAEFPAGLRSSAGRLAFHAHPCIKLNQTRLTVGKRTIRLARILRQSVAPAAFAAPTEDRKHSKKGSSNAAKCDGTTTAPTKGKPSPSAPASDEQDVDLCVVVPEEPLSLEHGAQAELQLLFTTVVSHADLVGVHYAGPPGPASRAVLATQCEVSHARRIFPCVDDPTVRLVYQLSLSLPSTVVFCMSNAPVMDVKPPAAGGVAPIQSIAFSPTRPIPSYAFGFFASESAMRTLHATCKDALNEGGEEIAFFVHALQDSAFPLEIPLRVMQSAVPLLTNFFAKPLEHKEMHLIVVPRMTLGGMENDGLIFLNEAVAAPLRHATNNAAARAKVEEEIVRLTVHEVAHHWIGNGVGLPFALKEGVVQLLEQCIGDVVLGRPMRKLKPSHAGASGSKQCDTTTAGDAVSSPTTSGLCNAECGKEFSGATYQVALAQLSDAVAQAGWDVFERTCQHLVAQRLHTYAPQEDFLAMLREE